MTREEAIKRVRGYLTDYCLPSGFTLRQKEVIKSVTRYCCIKVVFQTTGTKVIERSPGRFEVVQYFEQPLQVGTIAATFDPRYTSEEEIIQRVKEEYPKSSYFHEILRQYPDRYVDYVDVYVLADEDIETETEWIGTFNYR